MVAYSFNKRFEPAIREGWKTQTIRKGRARHARPGEMLQLFCGMRTAHCRKIVDDTRCTEVMAVRLCFDAGGVIDAIHTDEVAVRDLDAFAIRDGFTDIDDMSAFWRKEHGPLAGLEFNGVLIEWAAPRPLQPSDPFTAD